MNSWLNYIFTSLATLAIVTGLIATRGWNSTTALFPRAIGIPALILCITILVMSFMKERQGGGKKNTESDQALTTAVRRAAVQFAWILGLILLIWTIGINLAIPGYVLSYLRVQGKYRWVPSIMISAGVGGFVYLVFNAIFRIAWPENLLQRLLGL